MNTANLGDISRLNFEQTPGRVPFEMIPHSGEQRSSVKTRKGREYLRSRPTVSISVVNLAPVPCVHHAYHKLSIVHGVDDSIGANPEPVHTPAFLAQEPLYIALWGSSRMAFNTRSFSG